MSDITLTREQAQAVFNALDIGLGAATAEAAAYHEAMAGYRPHQHKALDDDAAAVSAALTLMGQLLETCALCRGTGTAYLTGPGGGYGTCPDCHGTGEDTPLPTPPPTGEATLTLLHQAAQKAVEALTDEQIKAIAHQWFVTGENQLRADGYYYRSLGTVTNVRESDLIAFAREVLARAEAWPAIREAITNDVMPNIRALQQQEVPREPVAIWQSKCKDGTWVDCDEANARAGERHGFKARVLYAASPSTTQQQEAGSIPPAKLVNGQWTGVPISRFPELQEQVRKGLADGTLSIGGAAAAAPSTPESAEKDDAGGVDVPREGQS